MFIRSYGLLLAVAFLVAVGGGGCRKSNSAQSGSKEAKAVAQPAAMQPSPHASVSRLHWLGKKRLGAETNAAYFMSIWNLPESARLEAQTLDKLALAPWRSQLTNDFLTVTNYQPLVADHPLASLLRPLLQDIVDQESYLEIRQETTNQPGELALAIRLDNANAGVWDTNLAVVAEALTGAKTTRGQSNGLLWQIQFTFHSLAKANDESAPTNHESRISDPDSGATHDASRTLVLSRSGGWTIVGLSAGSNRLTLEFANRIQAHPRGTPLTADGTNFWIDTDFNLRQVASALGLKWRLPANWPRVLLTAIGDGQNVRTRAELDFPQPLQLELEPWNIPTNIIHDPLIGFSAIRGIRPLLKSFKPWKDLRLGTPPNQAFFWAQAGPPPLHFMGVPSPEASNQVAILDEFALTHLNPILLANPMKVGQFEKPPEARRLIWKGIPLFSPTLDWADPTNPFVIAAFYPNRFTNQPPPTEMLRQVTSTTNLLVYDWEITGPCVQGLTVMIQMVRRLFESPRLPEVAISWLTAAGPKLGNAVTIIQATTADHWLIARKSSIGLTDAEIQLMIDWLESPGFPVGLRSWRGLWPELPFENLSSSSEGAKALR